MDIITLALAKQYTDTSLAGGGAIKGKNCVVDSITAITGGHRVTFKWTLDNGTEETGYMDVMDGEKGDKGNKGDTGIGIASVSVNSNNHLIITYEDSSTEDAGQIVVTTATFGGMLDVEFTDLADGQIAKYNAETHKWENAEDGGGSASWVDVTGTLTAGQTEITLSDPSITADSTIDIYTDVFGVNPTNMELVGSDDILVQGGISQESQLNITVTASSDNENAWKAFISGSGLWGLAESSDEEQWIQFELNTPMSLSQMSLTAPWGYSYPDNLVYSDNGKTWTNAPCTISGGSITITNAPAKKFWRVCYTNTPTKPGLCNSRIYGNGYSAVLTFPVQSENLEVKVRVS